jgi:hypothetical protein
MMFIRNFGSSDVLVPIGNPIRAELSGMSIVVTASSPSPIVIPASTPSSSGSGPERWAVADVAVSASTASVVAIVFRMFIWVDDADLYGDNRARDTMK